MKTLKQKFPRACFMLILSFLFISCGSIRIHSDVPGGGMIDHAILFCSDDASPSAKKVLKLKSIDLSKSFIKIDKNVESKYTNYWLIGVKNGDVVYTSNQNLNGTNLHSVKPYDGVSPIDFNIPNNIKGFVEGTGNSADWYAITAFNHEIHKVKDSVQSTLYTFNPDGGSLGSIRIDL